MLRGKLLKASRQYEWRLLYGQRYSIQQRFYSKTEIAFQHINNDFSAVGDEGNLKAELRKAEFGQRSNTSAQAILSTMCNIDEQPILPLQQKILNQQTCQSLLEELLLVDPAELSEQLSSSANQEFTRRFYHLVTNLVDEELFTATLDVQNLIIFIKRIAANKSAAVMPKSKIEVSTISSFDHTLLHMYITRRVKDRLKVWLLKYIMYPTDPYVHKIMLKTLTKEVLMSRALNAAEIVFSYLDTLATLQENLIKMDLLSYFAVQYKNYQTVLKGDAIDSKVISNYLDDSSTWYRQYRMKINPIFFKLLLSKLNNLQYSELLIKLLDSNIMFDTFDMDYEFKLFTKFLLSRSSAEDRALISGSNWNKELVRIKFSDKQLEYFQKIQGITERINVLQDPHHSIFINKGYFESKLVNLYPIKLVCSVILNNVKHSESLTNTRTFKLIDAISDNAELAKGTSYLSYLNRLEYENMSHLKTLVNVLFKQIQPMIEEKKEERYLSLVQKTRLLTKFLSVLLVYSMKIVGPDAFRPVLSKIIELNKQLANQSNIVLAKGKKRVKEDSVQQNVRLNYNYIILLLITGFREQGLLDESFKLINLLINLNSKNKNYQLEGFRYKSTVAKDIITEFLLSFKQNYPDNPKFMLSYLIEFLTNQKDILDHLQRSNQYDYNISNAELFDYYRKHPLLSDNHNVFSSFMLLNKMGLISLVYENDLKEINFDNSQQYSFYKKNLSRSNVTKELKNTRLTNESFSIFYSVLFEYLSSIDKLDKLLLKKMFDKYIDLVAKVQLVISKNVNSIHPFSKKNMSAVILAQFINKAIAFNDTDLAEQFLKTFLHSVVIDKKNMPISVFDKVVYRCSLQVFNNKFDDHLSRQYYEKVIDIIKIMNEEFHYPVTFWTKFSLILLHYRDKNSDQSYRLFLQLTHSATKFSNIRHVLLIKMAQASGWPLPEHLRNMRFLDHDSKELTDKDLMMPFQQIDLNKDDILEFENDKLERIYTDTLERKDNLNLNDLPAVDESKRLGYDYDGFDGNFFDEILALLPKTKKGESKTCL